MGECEVKEVGEEESESGEFKKRVAKQRENVNVDWIQTLT